MIGLKAIAKIFGVIMIIVGILGFVPQVTPGGLLFGIFEVDMMHNVVHLATGIIALLVSMNAWYAKMYFIIFGIVYLIVAIVGFANHGDLFMMRVNMADNWLHVVIAIIALYLGFFFKKSRMG